MLIKQMIVIKIKSIFWWDNVRDDKAGTLSGNLKWQHKQLEHVIVDFYETDNVSQTTRLGQH